MSGNGDIPDHRHHPLLVAIDNQYRAHNNGNPCPDKPRLAKAISLMLKSVGTKWSIDDLITCLVNRINSEDVNPSDLPHLWVKTLPKYLRGPLDRYGYMKHKKDNDDGCQEYWDARMRIESKKAREEEAWLRTQERKSME